MKVNNIYNFLNIIYLNSCKSLDYKLSDPYCLAEYQPSAGATIIAILLRLIYHIYLNWLHWDHSLFSPVHFKLDYRQIAATTNYADDKHRW